MLLLTLSFYARSRLGQKNFRLLHYTSFAVFLMVTVHGAAGGHGQHAPVVAIQPESHSGSRDDRDADCGQPPGAAEEEDAGRVVPPSGLPCSRRGCKCAGVQRTAAPAVSQRAHEPWRRRNQ